MFMQKALILLAGPPGTGKSYFGNQILKDMPAFEMVSPDSIREKIFDQYGFDNLEEKRRLTDLAWKEYYLVLEEKMKAEKMLLSDYPFSWKQRDRLQELTVRYGYRVITVRLSADIRILYERQQARDLALDRHRGHIFSHYHKGDEDTDRSAADDLVTFAHFEARARNRGYFSFRLGDLLEIDVTSFETARYEEKLQTLKKMLAENRESVS